MMEKAAREGFLPGLLRARFVVLSRALLWVAVALGCLGGAQPGLAAENPSGLPLPRFATTRSTPINVRVGPGTKYDVAWVYVKSGVPVEIVQEFDTWRKIRDVDGSEGWVHQNLLSGRRAGIVSPWSTAGSEIALRSGPNAEGSVRAYLAPGFRVDISECDGAWCKVDATHQPEGGRPATYSGFLPQDQLWGAYADERFD